MTYIIAILTILFVVLTFKVIAQTRKIIKTNRGETGEGGPSYQGAPDYANNMNAAALLIFWILAVVAITWSYIHYSQFFLPEASSVHGRKTDFWFWVSMGIITVAFFLVNTFLFLFSYIYRHSPKRKSSFYTHNNTLEVIWTTVPAVVMTGLVLSGLVVWNEITSEAPEDAEIIEITGRQFAWMVRYSGEDGEFGKSNYKLMDDGMGNPLGVDFTDPNAFDDFSSASELHIPKGKPVLLRIRARDVLHSVYIPHMRVKMDAVPGMPTKFWFIADKSTDEMKALLNNSDFDYEIACAEICGKSHFGMRLVLKVDEPENYEKWKREQKTILTLNPDLLVKVPEKLKAKALKYIETEAPAAAATDSTATPVAAAVETK
ncbi:cytochrome c oxidase subunit II [Leadbetterella sp. DM7]|uniref:cytochrome c oxidase subunit II n=1 Tax=Leadbetterella sp. DM7 TaxID=3235085 RepID=UPI00349E855B